MYKFYQIFIEMDIVRWLIEMLRIGEANNEQNSMILHKYVYICMYSVLPYILQHTHNIKRFHKAADSAHIPR